MDLNTGTVVRVEDSKFLHYDENTGTVVGTPTIDDDDWVRIRFSDNHVGAVKESAITAVEEGEMGVAV